MKKRNPKADDCGFNIPPMKESECHAYRPWLSTELFGNEIYGAWEYGYFHRVIAGDHYMFPAWVCVSFN